MGVWGVGSHKGHIMISSLNKLGAPRCTSAPLSGVAVCAQRGAPSCNTDAYKTVLWGRHPCSAEFAPILQFKDNRDGKKVKEGVADSFCRTEVACKSLGRQP